MNEFTLKEYVDEQVIRLEQRDEFEAKVNDIRLNEIKAVAVLLILCNVPAIKFYS